MERISSVPGPALATLTRERFSSDAWVYERKMDGVRCLAYVDGGRVGLCSRNRGDQRRAFPEVVEALEAQRCPDAVLDGEVVAFDGAQTSFAALQPRIHLTSPERARRTGVAVFYYLFDLLHLDGHSTRTLPLRERKSLLRDLLDWDDPLRYTEHRNADGEAYYRQACADGWEGLIAKRADAPYRSGRTRDWLKFKCEQGQEFVIGGWTDPRGSREGFGALLLGYYAGGEAGGEAGGRDLVYAGKVGTGFDHAMLRSLHARLSEMERSSPAFERGPRLPGSGVHWAEPRLVGEVSFTEWTRDGQLRHPRFLGLRTDKKPRDVVREVPEDA
jgi:bifunctional non-homologous end joining protein LigD